MTLNSLAFRLLVGAAVWSVMALALGGFTLSSLFRTHVEQSFDARIELLLDSLAAGIDVGEDGTLELQRPPAESLFDRPFSGWYWQIGDGNGPALRSRSLWDQTLTPAGSEMPKVALSFRNDEGPENQDLRIMRRVITLPGSTKAYLFEVAGDRAGSQREIRRFNTLLAWALGLMGGGLIVAMLIQVHFGLRPLRQIRVALARIRAGHANRLETGFPAEIAPLATEINTLLEHNADVVTRARTHVGNLAHALKTPLSVLSNEAAQNDGEFAERVRQQTILMRRQVDHHLTRARAAATAGVLGARTEVAPIARDLARTLERIHLDRSIVIAVNAATGLAFRGEQQDLEEMVGNLLDNAAKWADRRVALHAEAVGDQLCIAIEDDGPGLDEAERAEVMERGKQLDETVTGSGLGLAIVRDIADLYDGDIRLAPAPQGGLRAVLTLPLADDGLNLNP